MSARKGRLQHWDYSMLLRSISFMVSREQFILNWEYLIWFASVDIFLIIPGNFYGLINVNPLKLFILGNNMHNSNISWHFTNPRNVVKNLPAMQETWVQSLGLEDPLKKGIATHSSILTWRIPWTEEPEGYSPWGCKESDMSEVTEYKHG